MLLLVKIIRSPNDLSTVKGWSLYLKLDSREIHWLLELDLEPQIAEQFENKRKKENN